MNIVVISGYTTSDIECTYKGKNNETIYAKFVLAVKNFVNDEKNISHFVDCIAFGKLAEFLERYVKKGTQLALHGKLSTHTYDNKDGKRMKSMTVVVEAVDVVKPKSEKSEKPNENESPAEDVYDSYNDPYADLPFA